MCNHWIFNVGFATWECFFPWSFDKCWFYFLRLDNTKSITITIWFYHLPFYWLFYRGFFFFLWWTSEFVRSGTLNARAANDEHVNYQRKMLNKFAEVKRQTQTQPRGGQCLLFCGGKDTATTTTTYLSAAEERPRILTATSSSLLIISFSPNYQEKEKVSWERETKDQKRCSLTGTRHVLLTRIVGYKSSR